MIAIEAFREGVRLATDDERYNHERLRQMDYLAEIGLSGLVPDEWETPAEADASNLALCRGFVALALHEAWQRCDEPRPEFRMLVGPVAMKGPDGKPRWHAIAEMKDADGRRKWADVQARRIGPPEEFPWFTPEWAFAWTGARGFTTKIDIEEVV